MLLKEPLIIKTGDKELVVYDIMSILYDSKNKILRVGITGDYFNINEIEADIAKEVREFIEKHAIRPGEGGE